MKAGRAPTASVADDERGKHVGYYLIARGRPHLERAAQMRPRAADVVGRLGRRMPLALYLGAIVAITMA